MKSQKIFKKFKINGVVGNQDLLCVIPYWIIRQPYGYIRNKSCFIDYHKLFGCSQKLLIKR